MFDIKKELKRLPKLPGVYLMKDNDKNVIYVGKAKNLKNRVNSYFNKNHDNLKTKTLVSNIKEFEYIITSTEVESLILECTLIKEYYPKYNILFKDGKTYPYIKITIKEDYPRIMKVRKIINDKNKYFGPYTSEYMIKNVIELINKIYKLRTCKKNIEKMRQNKERPCLNYYIGKCIGPCRIDLDKEEYDKAIKEIIDILNGNTKDLIKELEEKMYEASKNLEFEKANDFKIKIESLRQINEKQNMVMNKIVDEDIINIYMKNNLASIEIFFIREGKIIKRENHIIDNVEFEEEKEILISFMNQYYNYKKIIPKEIILPFELENKELIEEFLFSLKGNKVKINTYIKGRKKELLNLVKKNAKESLQNYISIKDLKKKAKEDLFISFKEVLDLNIIPNRIEAYDISHIQGVDSVGSMVVYENGKKSKKEYRRFKIKSHDGIDDYLSMSEIIERRFNNKKLKLPDLILLDGGQTHFNIINKLLLDMNINIPVFGMYKDDKHKTKGLVGKDIRIDLDKKTAIYKFIASIQEEVHRFAIDYHRSLRTDKIKKSKLDEIEGVGQKRKINLLIEFKSIENISRATIEDLSKVEGMNKKIAKNVYEFFNKN